MVGTDAGDLGLPVPPFQLAQQRSTRPREGQSAGTSIRNCRRPRVPPCGNGKLGTGGRDSGQRWPPTCWQRRIAGTPSMAVGAWVRLLGRWQSVPARVHAGLRMLALEHGAERSTTVAGSSSRRSRRGQRRRRCSCRSYRRHHYCARAGGVGVQAAVRAFSADGGCATKLRRASQPGCWQLGHQAAVLLVRCLAHEGGLTAAVPRARGACR